MSKFFANTAQFSCWVLVLSLAFLRGQAIADDEAPAASETAVTEANVAEGSESQPAEAAQSDTAKTYDLKYKFTAGEVLRTEVTHRASVQTTIKGTSLTAETQSKSVKIWTVESVTADGVATFQHMVENIDMWQRNQGRPEVKYNSQTDSAAPPGYEEVAKAVGVPLSIVTMDSRGTILKRREKLAQPMSVSTQMTMPLPGKPVTVGESWSSPNDIDVTLKDGAVKKIQTRQKFKLVKVADHIATISVDSQILTPNLDPAVEAQLIQRLSAGEVKFDMEAGRVLSQQLDLDRHVIGFSGPASSMHYVTRFTEQLLPTTAPQTARRASPVASAPKAATAKAAPPKATAAKSPAAKANPAPRASQKPNATKPR